MRVTPGSDFSSAQRYTGKSQLCPKYKWDASLSRDSSGFDVDCAFLMLFGEAVQVNSQSGREDLIQGDRGLTRSSRSSLRAKNFLPARLFRQPRYGTGSSIPCLSDRTRGDRTQNALYRFAAPFCCAHQLRDEPWQRRWVALIRSAWSRANDAPLGSSGATRLG